MGEHSQCTCTNNRQKKLDKEFARNTTCHGLSRLEQAQNPTMKIFWTLAVLLCFGLLFWQVSVRVITYFENKSSTNIEKVYNIMQNFPAVTICDYNRYRTPNMTEADKYLLYTIPNLIYKSSLEGVDVSELLEEYEYNITAGYPGGYNLKEVEERVSWNMNESLILCLFDGIPCYSKTKIFTPVFTDFGLCHTFNIDGSINFTQWDIGAGHGLRLMLDMKTEEYGENFYDLELARMESGIKFYVHPAYEPPDMKANGQSVSPGLHAFASIKTELTVTEEPPYGHCNKSASLQFYPRYTYSGCMLECMRDLMLKMCNCTPSYIPGNNAQCSFTTTNTCIQEVKEITRRTFACFHCTQPCEEIVYPTSVSYATFPTEGIGEKIASQYNTTTENIKKNHLMLDIYFTDLYNHTITITPAVTPTGLLSDIGGQMGLFVGISVLTVIEFLEYFVKRCYYMCSNTDPETENGRGQDNQVNASSDVEKLELENMEMRN
ncbi:unnamed protein product [Owenia fusiformis]|uniref:Uncharacterized protein n=1 Tax=Owenia fusiformis TaxID=6347 RepID=A0A8S4NR55_OWEFU|nr:unnamed protein product [Owenia fusiformis]